MQSGGERTISTFPLLFIQFNMLEFELWADVWGEVGVNLNFSTNLCMDQVALKCVLSPICYGCIGHHDLGLLKWH